MKMWWTLPELAARSLPDLPGTKQGLAAFSLRGGWRDAARADGSPLARKRRGLGGGWEYHVSLLPLSAQAALGVGHAVAAREDDTVPDLAVASEKGQRVRDARLAIIDAAARWRETTRLPQNEADAAFCAAYNNNQVAMALAVRVTVKSVSRAALYRWRAAVRCGDGAVIAARQGRRKGSSLLDLANDGAVATVIGAMLVNNPHFTAYHIQRYVGAKFPQGLDMDGTLVPVPSLAAFRRHIAEFKATHTVALSKITNPDEFKNRYRIAGLTQARHADLSRVNECWQIDASPVDALCIDGRYSIYLCIDIWSRRVISYVTRTPRASAVQLLLRKAILTWGVPATIDTDNGSDFVARSTVALLAALAISHHRCDPYQGQQKGHVERVVGTFQRDCAVMMPGFIGHNVGDRKRIEARKSFAERLGCSDEKAFSIEMTSSELAAYLDTWCEAEYGHRPHAGLGGGMSPFAKAASCTARPKRVESERALDVLLMEPADGGGLRTVSKQGIRVGGDLFIAPGIMVAEKVLVRLDPADLGRLYCFSPDGAQYLGEAICPETIGVSRAAAVAEARAQQNQMIADQTAAIRREAKAITPRDVIDTILRASAERAGKLVEFPRASDPHATPGLDAAGEAVGRRGAIREARLTDEQKARHAAMVAAFDAGDAPTNVVPLAPKAAAKADPVADKKRRYREWLALAAAEQRGDTLSDDERRHLVVYPTLSEYRAIASMVADFGPEWLEEKSQRAAQ